MKWNAQTVAFVPTYNLSAIMIYLRLLGYIDALKNE